MMNSRIAHVLYHGKGSGKSTFWEYAQVAFLTQCIYLCVLTNIKSVEKAPIVQSHPSAVSQSNWSWLYKLITHSIVFNLPKIMNRFILVILFVSMSSFRSVWANDPGHSNGHVNGHLVLSAIKNPLAKDPNSTVVQAGIVEEILLDILSEKLNFTYYIHPPSDMLSAGLLLPNGSWTGSTGQLQRKEVDMLVTTTAPTLAKRNVLDVSHPVFFVETAILIPFPSEGGSASVILLVFQPAASVAVAALFTSVIFSAWILHRISNPNKYDKSQTSLSYWLFFFISIYTSQGVYLRNSNASFRIFWAVSFFAIFIICNYYTATYTSLVSTPTFKPAVNSIEELADSTTVKALIVKGSTTEEFILMSTDPTLKKIGDQLRAFPERRITDTYTVSDISNIVKDNYALIIIKPTAESLIQNSFKVNGKCRVTLAERTFYSRGQSYTYQKNSRLTDVIDYQILLMQQFGLTTYADRRANGLSRNPCSISDVKTAQTKRSAVMMKLKETTGVFIILGVGIALAACAFVIEKIAKKMEYFN